MVYPSAQAVTRTWSAFNIRAAAILLGHASSAGPPPALHARVFRQDSACSAKQMIPGTPFRHPGRERRRSRSAPPRGFRQSQEPTMEDIAAMHLARTYRVIWQYWEPFWQCWYDYSPHHNRLIEKAHQNDATELSIHDRDGEVCWTINFVRLLQVSSQSGKIRFVRRMLATHS